jgi:hypothetical protein
MTEVAMVGQLALVLGEESVVPAAGMGDPAAEYPDGGDGDVGAAAGGGGDRGGAR